MHKKSISRDKSIGFHDLCLIDELWTCLADLNKQAQRAEELFDIDTKEDLKTLQRRILKYSAD